VQGLQSAVVRHRRTTDDYIGQLRVLQQVIVGLLIALVVFGVGVATIEGARNFDDTVAQGGSWCGAMFNPDADLDTSCIDDHRLRGDPQL
jgi:hypothetical protein